jgi:hypothetical protein
MTLVVFAFVSCIFLELVNRREQKMTLGKKSAQPEAAYTTALSLEMI